MEKTKETLEEIGLSEKEANVYLALLQLGESTASRVSEIANLNRITTYTLLKSLQEKGFCSIYEKNKVRYFKSIKPENILYLLEEKKNKLKTILPLLKKEEKKIEEKPEISLFEGKNGISSMLDIILKDAEKDREILIYGNLSLAEKLMEYQSLHWRKTRIAKKIKIRGIVDSIPSSVYRGEQWRKLSEARINKNLAKINSYVLFTKNFVAYLTLKGELIGILIKSKELAEKEKFNLKLLWKISKK